MNLSWTEITCLYLVAALPGGEIARLGCMNHSVQETGTGLVLVGYALARAWQAGKMWRKARRKESGDTGET